MEIKSNRSERPFGKLMRRVQIKIILLVFVWILIISVAFFAGALMYRTGMLYRVKTLLKNPLTVCLNYIQARLANPERIYVDMDYKEVQKLAYWRALALENGTLYGIDHDYVNAQIRHKDQTVRANIRLKGGMADQHLAGNKWSLRVRIRGGKTVLGMKNFVLMDPKRRSRLHSWILREVLRKEGVISKRYKFVELIINGENKGIYAMDEHYGKEMLEANQRREGPIIRVSQVPLWMERAAFDCNPEIVSEYYLCADVDAIGSGKMESNQALLRQFEQARRLFNAFRNGELAAHEVFDIDKLAKWMAVSNILGGWHGIETFTIRFYYNPITARLEPAPEDEYDELYKEYAQERLFSLHHVNTHKFFNQIFSDLGFIEKYIQNLERVSRKSYLDNMLEEIGGEMEKNLHILQRDDLYYNSPREQLYKSQEYIRRILNPYKGITAYFQQTGPENLTLRIANVKEIPMEILSVGYGDNAVLKPAQGKTILPGKDLLKPLVYEEVEFSFPEGFSGIESASKLKVNYKLLGTSILRSEPVFLCSVENKDFPDVEFMREQPNFQDFPFIKQDLSAKEIYIDQGDWTLENSLIIPQGYVFIINAGARLNLTKGSRILSYSPIRLIGSEERPVVIDSPDGSGQGIVVLNVGAESFLENAVFENLSEPIEAGRQLTGAITFYESPVKINKCRFLTNNSEDALNIIRSRFMITNSLFRNTEFDALDADFCRGSIHNTSFVDCGNDAMDFSGSVISISKSFINGAGDKGISVGEDSRAVLKQVEIANSNIGIASKDFSNVEAEDIQVRNSRIAFAVYQKKPEFGPATISVEKASLLDVPTMHLVEERSSLCFNGKMFAGSQRDVAERIYRE